MTKEDNKPENSSAGNKPQIEKTPLKKQLLEWFGYLAVFAVTLFFFAPESWWQFGVSPESERKAGANFSLMDFDGKRWNFDDQRGRIVVVNYWATWCPPCRLETPGLVNFANEYKERGFVERARDALNVEYFS